MTAPPMNATNRQQNQKGPAGPAFSPANPFFGLLPREFAGRLKDPFVYNIVITVGATTTNTGTTQIQNDSDFVWTQGVVVVTDTPGTTFTTATTIPALVSLTDSASGRQLQDQATHMSAWFGTAQLPFFLQMPKIFRAGGQVSALVQNQSAGTLVFRLSFHGFKCFPMPAQ
jgi:hypothetical protein